MESNQKKNNTRTVIVMALVFIFVLGVLAYVSGTITNLSDAPETTIILTSCLVGITIAAIVALIRLSREKR